MERQLTDESEQTDPAGDADRPANTDPVVRGLSEAIGGPLGEHAVPPGHRFWTPVRVVLALAALLLAAHWVQKSPCQDGAWSDLKQYKQYCYTDVLALYYSERLSEGKVPYRGGINEGQWFYNINALVLSILAVGAVGAVLAMRRARPWDAALLALAPGILVSATVNWDLLVIALTTFALYAWG